MFLSWLSRRRHRCRNRKPGEGVEAGKEGKEAPPTASSLLSKTKRVNDVALTPNGKFFCLAVDRTPAHRRITAELHPTHNAVPVYEYANAALRSRYVAHAESVWACALSDDGVFGASANFTGETCVWRADTARHLVRFAGHSAVVSDLDFTPAGDFLVSAAKDCTIIMWDVSTAARRRTFMRHSRPVSACAVNMDGNGVLTAGEDGMLFHWDTRQNEPVATITPHNRRGVTYCAPDKLWRTLVTTGFDRRVGLWDARMYKLIFDTEVNGSIMYGCDISGDGARFIACGENGSLRLWNSAKQTDTDSLSGHDVNMRVSRCAINDDGTRVVSVGHDKTARFFDLVQLAIDADALCLPSDEVAVIKIQSSVAALYEKYMNQGEQLTASKLKSALASDYSRRALCGLSDVFLAHVMIKTALKSGIVFDSLFDGVEGRNTFFHGTVYHKLAELMRTENEKEFGHMLLMDAQKNGLLEISDVRHIMGDAQVLDVEESMSARFRTVFAEICAHLQNQLDSMESRLQSVAVDLQRLRAETDKLKEKMEREAKIGRWAKLVKLGVSLLPIAGSIATEIVDVSAELFLSFDMSSVVKILSNFTGNASQDDRDSCAGGNEVEQKKREEITAVRLVQLLSSSTLLNRIPECDSDAIRKAILTNYGADSDELFRNTFTIIEEHESLETLPEPQAIEEA